jgi:molecular chaperone GrpE
MSEEKETKNDISSQHIDVKHDSETRDLVEEKKEKTEAEVKEEEKEYEEERGTEENASQQDETNETAEVKEPLEPDEPVEREINREHQWEEEKELTLSEALKQIISKLETVDGRLQQLETGFQSKIQYDKHKDKMIDELHGEVQKYKNDLLKNLTRPIIMDIIHAIDDITKLVTNHQEKDPAELDPQKLIKQMAGISSDLEYILFRQGVDPFEFHQPGFDPKCQKVIKTENTHEVSKDKTISKRVHKGYQWEGKVLRPEMVNVYVCKPESTDPGINKNNNDEENNNHE